MKYGLPYKGSKNKLAERIVRLLPKRAHLIDLFCGGCAVSHAALLMGKYEHIHINDLNWMCPTLFMDALDGKYANETRWISREDFQRLKDTDPYVAVVWSFGNNMRDYLYSREIEPLKKAIHYAIFFGDYSLGKELGHDLSFIDDIAGLTGRYQAVKHYFSRMGYFQQQSFEGGDFRMESVERLQTSIGIAAFGMYQQSGAIQKKKTTGEPGNQETSSDGTALYRLQYRERQNSLPRYSGGGNPPITSSVLDYAEVEIPADSVIYCDIPYEETNKYNGADKFDYERFYDWCERQTQPVFISSYNMPADRFDCIQEFSHRSTLSATANNLVTERIFVPKHQKERGNTAIQLTLF